MNIKKYIKSVSVVLFFLSEVVVAGNNATKAPTGDIAIVTNWGGDTISLVNTNTQQELSKIKVGPKPYDVKVEASGQFAYVTDSGADFISKVDLVANLERVGERIKVGQSPRDINLTSDNKRAVVANSGSDSISVVDLKSGKELYQVPVGPIPYGIGLTLDDATAIVTLWGSAKAVIVSLGEKEGKVQKTLDIGPLPYTVATTVHDNYALATCFGNQSVYVIDIKNQKVLGSVSVGKSPWGLAISPDGETGVVANFYSGDVSVLKIADIAPEKLTHDPLGAVENPVSEKLRFSLVDPLGATSGSTLRAKNAAFGNDPNVVLMSDLARNKVMLLDIKQGKLIKEISVGEAPYGIAFLPKRTN